MIDAKEMRYYESPEIEKMISSEPEEFEYLRFAILVNFEEMPPDKSVENWFVSGLFIRHDRIYKSWPSRARAKLAFEEAVTKDYMVLFYSDCGSAREGVKGWNLAREAGVHAPHCFFDPDVGFCLDITDCYCVETSMIKNLEYSNVIFFCEKWR